MFARTTLALAIGLITLPASANIEIVFSYEYDTNHFFGNDDTDVRRVLLKEAASVFESRILDDLTAITPSGNNRFQVEFKNPANPGGTFQPDTYYFEVPANQITIFVGGANLNDLKGPNTTPNTLGLGGPGKGDPSGSPSFVYNALTRGESGVALNDPITPVNEAAQGNSTDFSLWGGMISFNSGYGSWFYDTTLGTANDIVGADFYSVALHEIGHVLGIGTADSWDHWTNGSSFEGQNTGPTALDMFYNQATNKYEPTGHWVNGTTSTIDGVGSYETVFDPSLSLNQRKLLTDLDWNALRDVGWEVSAVPEPETWAMLLAGLGLVAAVTRHREA